MVKILVVGDLHGRMPKIHFKDFDCIVQVGDVCDDREFRPYYKKGFKNLKRKEYTKSISKFLEKELGKKDLEKMEKRSIERGCEILKYLASFGKPVIFVPGNWDFSYGKITVKDPDKDVYNYLKYFYQAYMTRKSNPGLVKGIKNLYDSQYKLHEVLGINFIGYGLISGRDHYLRVKRKVTEKQLERLKEMYSKIEESLSNEFRKRDKNLPTVFLSHNMPKGVLDKIKDQDNANCGKHFGSELSRKMIFKFKPEICLGGHMHENQGKKKLGKTLVINAGYGRDAQVFIDFDEKNRKAKKVEFY